MPTITEAAVAYIPRNTVQFNENGIKKPPPRSVKDVTANVQEIVEVPSAPAEAPIGTATAAAAGKSKALIIGGIVAIGAALVIACAVTVGVIFGVNRLSASTSTTTATTTTSVTTTSATTTTTTATTTAIAPGNLVGYRGNINQTYSFLLTGAISGSIWGTTIYTDDSSLVTAAVHSGFVQVGQVAVVTVIILAGQSSYTSSTQNGVTSAGWGGWAGSYSFLGASVVG